jgi:hypothetical protein
LAVVAAVEGDLQDVRSWGVWEALAAHIAVLLRQADEACIQMPTDLMNQLGRFHARALHKEAEPLLRRALAINEVNFGPDHPTVAIRLSHLARVLQDTNRLGEAEPLLRRVVEIFHRFALAPGNPHSHFGIAVRNYRALLQAMHLSPAEIAARLAPFSTLPPDSPNDSQAGNHSG